MDGIETVINLRKRNWKGKIIAVTANASEDDRKRCFEVGFDAFLSKPIKQKEIINIILQFTGSGPDVRVIMDVKAADVAERVMRRRQSSNV